MVKFLGDCNTEGMLTEALLDVGSVEKSPRSRLGVLLDGGLTNPFRGGDPIC